MSAGTGRAPEHLLSTGSHPQCCTSGEAEVVPTPIRDLVGGRALSKTPEEMASVASSLSPARTSGGVCRAAAKGEQDRSLRSWAHRAGDGSWVSVRGVDEVSQL